MKYSELIKKRYSVRSYSDLQVEQEKIDYILEAGRIAPTAANRQPQIVISVTREEGLASIDNAANRFGAPVVLIVCADHEKTWKRSYDNMDSAYIDASIVTNHMLLAATDCGLGSLWICKFDPSVIREKFGLPDNVEPVNLLCLGYADEKAELSPAASSQRHQETRIPLSSTVHHEKFREQ